MDGNINNSHVTIYVMPIIVYQLFLFVTVKALEVIASKLGYSGWQPSSDSCITGRGLNQTIALNEKGLIKFGSNVTCSCNTTVCHITNMYVSISFYHSCLMFCNCNLSTTNNYARALT